MPREFVSPRLADTEIDGSFAMTAIIDHFPDADFSTLLERRRLARVAACVAVSLAVHALLLSIYRQPQPAAVPAAPSGPLTVRLQAAPATPPAAEPARPAAQPKARARPAPEAQEHAQARAPRRIIAVPPQPAAADAKPFAVDTPPAKDTAPAPHFDLDAARGIARRVANEPDPAREGTALERLPPKPLETETKLERAIKEAKRPDCKDGVPGGLLAPLFLMMDKKDSGCKW
jgi:hypothetical protein